MNYGAICRYISRRFTILRQQYYRNLLQPKTNEEVKACLNAWKPHTTKKGRK